MSDSPAPESEPEVLVSIAGVGAGRLTLNRPKALGAH